MIVDAMGKKEWNERTVWRSKLVRRKAVSGGWRYYWSSAVASQCSEWPDLPTEVDIKTPVPFG